MVRDTVVLTNEMIQREEKNEKSGSYKYLNLNFYDRCIYLLLSHPEEEAHRLQSFLPVPILLKGRMLGQGRR